MTTQASSSPAAAPIKTLQIDALSVLVYRQQADMARDVARIAQQYLQEVLSRQPSAAVILATGNSQIQFLETLIAIGGVDWSRLILFHLDEYLDIEAAHPSSFRHYMRERVEQGVKPREFHYLQGDTALPLDECARYSSLLEAQPIDLC